jgi:riboflavin kinase
MAGESGDGESGGGGVAQTASESGDAVVAETAGGDKSEEAPTASAKVPLVVERSRNLLEKMPALRAKVVHGFGRGSKTLGFPTANMEVRWEKEDSPGALEAQEQDILSFAQSCTAGIYYAWAQVANGPDRGVHKAAMSIGWNPTFTDVKRKTIEPWILHDYDEDFYDCELRLIVCGFVRPELKFDSFDDLITAIREDGDFCRQALDEPECVAKATDKFFASST